MITSLRNLDMQGAPACLERTWKPSAFPPGSASGHRERRRARRTMPVAVACAGGGDAPQQDDFVRGHVARVIGDRGGPQAASPRGAPVYRRHWWSEHDRATRAWIADVSARLREVGPQADMRGPFEERIRREAAALGKKVPGACGTSASFTSQVKCGVRSWRRVASSTNLTCTRQRSSTGAPKSPRVPVETHLKPYVEGRISAQTAFRALIESLPQ
jgi:hypothetical protein